MDLRVGPALAAALALLAAGAAEAADLAPLRERALALVNAARAERGLPALALGEDIGEAAQAHAEDMARRGYYAHRSPEGEDVADRYAEAGGSPSNAVAENIALCGDCPTPPDDDAVERLHRLWMESPGHRANILARGLARFGFGARADARGRLLAVQTFAGPGLPPGVGPGEEPRPLPAGEATAAAARLLNEARRERGLPPLEASGPLTDAARALLPDDPGGGRAMGEGGPLDAVPREHRPAWGSVTAVAGTCTGCGAGPTEADLRFFRERWLGDQRYRDALLDPALTRLGFAVRADGEGAKAAVAMLGAPR
jgi:uncharacterized protein YkwD